MLIVTRSSSTFKFCLAKLVSDMLSVNSIVGKRQVLCFRVRGPYVNGIEKLKMRPLRSYRKHGFRKCLFGTCRSLMFMGDIVANIHGFNDSVDSIGKVQRTIRNHNAVVKNKNDTEKNLRFL